MIILLDILGVLLKIILFAFLAFLVLVLLILFVPFNYSIIGQVNEEASVNFHIRWAPIDAEFNILGLKPCARIRIFGTPVISGPMKKISRKKSSEKAGKSKRKVYGIRFFKAMLSLFKEILSVLKPKEIKAEGYYSLDDPALTAAASYIINLVAEAVPWAQTELYPVFDSEMVDFKICMRGRIVLIVLVCIVLKYVFKKEVRDVLFCRHTYNERI